MHESIAHRGVRGLACLVCALALSCASGRDSRGSGMSPRDAGARDAGGAERDAGRSDGGRRDAGGGDPCAAVDCSTLDGPCAVGVCNPTDGTCSAMARGDGTDCDDGDACTGSDLCTGGTCAGTPRDCSSSDGPCGAGVCDPTTGACVVMPVPDGTACDDGSRCTSGDRCTRGACTAGATVDCSAMTTACRVGMCDAATGTCTSAALPEGSICDDGNTCTSGDACRAGACSGTAIPGCGGGTLMPGRTDLVATMDGWSVRCLAWSGRTCVHGQARMDCTVCPAYPQCGVWHDVTTFNDGEFRCSGPWCAIATGNGTVLATGTGGPALTAPRACGWGSTMHPICMATRATYHPRLGGVDPNYGLLLDDAYCLNGTTLRTFDCAGW